MATRKEQLQAQLDTVNLQIDREVKRKELLQIKIRRDSEVADAQLAASNGALALLREQKEAIRLAIRDLPPDWNPAS